MISLPEDMVGMDPVSVLTPGLRCCLGFFVELTNGSIMGVHATPSTTMAEMNMLVGHVRVSAAGTIRWMAMVSKYQHWTNADSGLTSAVQLTAYFRHFLRYLGPMHYADMTYAPVSYDVLCTGGVTPALSWRATPNPMPCTPLPSTNVRGLVGVLGVRTLQASPNIMPNNVGGFSAVTGFNVIN